MLTRRTFLAIPAVMLTFTAGCSSSTPVTVANDPQINWGPAPSIFPPGAQFAVLQGDPGGSAPFTIRLKLPDGYKIMPHTHPTDENLTVISGAFSVGMGSTFKGDGMLALPSGGFVVAPSNHAHYGEAHGETVVQVHALGPFAMTYVNPTDTPKAAQVPR